MTDYLIQYMLIPDASIARTVFEFAASTTANNNSDAEFGLDMFTFSDGFSINIFQTGEINPKSLSNVGSMGEQSNFDLGGNHLIKDATWTENNHSHPGTNPLTPSGFLRYKINGADHFEPKGMGDRTFTSERSRIPQMQYVYGALEGYIEYNIESARLIRNRK